MAKESAKRTPRWKRRKSARPAELLEAAIAVFSSTGFAQGRLEDVAEFAGVTRPTIYLYFKDKKDLLRAMAREFAPGPKVREAASAMSGLPLDQQLQKALLLITAEMRQVRAAQMLHLMITESMNYPDAAREYRIALSQNVVGVLGAIIARGMAEDVFSKGDVVTLARVGASVPTMIAFYAATWERTYTDGTPNPYATEAFADEHARAFVRGLTREPAMPLAPVGREPLAVFGDEE